MLRVRLFGGLRVESMTATDIGSRKARTLLAVLAAARGEPVPSDRLAAAVWGDTRPASPGDQLGVLVSRLRRTLGPNAIHRAGGGFRLEPHWLDLAEFRDRAAEAAERLSRGAAGAALASATAALQLAAGPLLAGEDGEWAEEVRRETGRVLADVRLVASEAALTTGRPVAAAAAAETVLDHEPYDEAALRLLMRAHVAAGRPAAALTAFARVQARLRDDLGVDPTAQTLALHTTIVRGELDAGSTQDGAADLPGRTAELIALDAHLDAAAAGHGRVVVVEGEPGIGKTALLHAFAVRSRSRATVIEGSCDALGRDLPLQPLLDGLDAYLRSLGAEHAGRVLGPDAGTVAPLLGSVTEDFRQGGPPAPSDHAEARARLFAALLRVLARAGEHRPTVIAVDEFHLAGPSTLEWVRFAARRAERTLLVLAQRPADVMVPEAAVRLRLGALDRAAADRLVGRERAAAVWARSGGNPLLMLALAAGRAGDELPDTVHDAVARLLDGLGGAESSLRAAAVLGRRIDLDLLAGVTGRPITAVLDDLEAGARARLVTDGESGLEFTHELVRDALAESVSRSRRVLLHRAAAEVLRQRPGRDPMATAWHARLAGELDLASAELVRAGELADRRHDFAAAERLLAEAVELQSSPTARLAMARVLLRRGEYARAAASAEAAIAAGAGGAGYELAGWVAYYQRDWHRALHVANLGAALPDAGPSRASCHALAGRILHTMGELAASEQRFEAVADTAAGAAGVSRVWLAGLRIHLGRPRDALDLADAAVADAAAIEHPFAVGHAHFARWYSLAMLGRPAAALASIEAFETAEATRPLATGRYAALLHNMRAWMLRGVGMLPAAAEASEAAIELATFPGLEEPRFHARLDLVETALQRGGIDDAAGMLDGIPAFPDTSTMRWTLDERRRLLEARLALAAGDSQRAEAIATELVTAAAARGSVRHELVARVLVACARATLRSTVDRNAVGGVLTGLQQVAGLEAWRWTALVARSLGVAEWQNLADRQLAALAREAGQYAGGLLAYARAMSAPPR